MNARQVLLVAIFSSVCFVSNFTSISFAETNRTGGPDASGYQFIDSSEPNGPVFAWENHTASANYVITSSFTSTDDGYAGPINLPFSFPFYGTNYSQIYLSTNGYVTFGGGSSSIPYSSLPNAGVAGIYFWGYDLYINQPGTLIRYEGFTNPTRVVFTFDSLSLSSGLYRLSAQVILFPDGKIITQYRNILGITSAYAIGIQNAGGSSYLNYGTPVPTENSAIEFFVPCYRVAYTAPLNHAIQISLTPSIHWTPGICVVNSDIYLSTDSAAVATMQTAARVASTITDTTWSPSVPLLSNHTYYWRVLSRDATESLANPVWSFHTQGTALSGTYTIGGTNPDYTTIHNAIYDINFLGLAGDVTFLIRGGTYNEPPDSISTLAGWTTNAHLTFKPAGTESIVINKASAAYGYRLFGTDYVTFDGSNSGAPGQRLITINSTSNTAGVISIASGCDYCSFKNLNLNTTATSGFNFYGYANSATYSNSDSILNCFVQGSSSGIALSYLSRDWIVANNLVYNFSNTGITPNGNNHTVLNNKVWIDNLSGSSKIGISYDWGVNAKIDGNWIYGLTTGIIAELAQDTNTSITNNMINLDANGPYALTGITIYHDENAWTKIINNTIHIGGVATGNMSSMCILLSGQAHDTLANNIFYNERSGNSTGSYHVCMNIENSLTYSPFAVSDYNLFSIGDESTTDNRYVAKIVSTNYNTFQDLRNATGYIWDVHSISTPPYFVSPPDLHIQSLFPTAVESAGTHFASVTRDIDGDLRNAVAPDIGCDEGNFLTGTDVVAPSITMSQLPNWGSTGVRVVPVGITDNSGVATGTNAPRLYYKRSIESSWSWHNADSTRDGIYYFAIPGYNFGSNVQYYAAAQDINGLFVTYPQGGSGYNPPGTTPPGNVGTYWVGVPVNGTKYIGGPVADFSTIREAIEYLNALGTTTGVTFLINPGTYNEPPDSIVSSSGAGAQAHIVFRPADTAEVIINKNCTANLRFGFKLANVDYVTFDGSYPLTPGRQWITLTSSDSSCYYGFMISNGSDRDCIKNLAINLQSRYYTYGVYGSYDGTVLPDLACNSDTVFNCTIERGMAGVFLNSAYGNNTINHWVISNNRIFNFSSYGISMSNCSNMFVSHNTIYRTVFTNTGYMNLYGIYDYYVSNAVIDGNWIYDLGTSSGGDFYGIWGQYYYQGAGGTISNNMINLDYSGATLNPANLYGIYTSILQATFAYNTVHIGGSTTSSSLSAAIDFESNSTSTLKNNIFINDRTSAGTSDYHVCMLANSNAYNSSDYNIYSNSSNSSSDNRFVARAYNSSTYQFVNCNTLAEFRTLPGFTGESHSVEALPAFVGAPDLHINSSVVTPVESAGTNVTGITTDIDGQLRDATHPDIGCDEGNFLGNDYTPPTIHFTPLDAWTQLEARTISATITDNRYVARDTSLPRVFYKSSTETVWNNATAFLVESDSIFYFSIPAYPLYTNVQYYLAAEDTSGNYSTFPAGGLPGYPRGLYPPPTILSYMVVSLMSGIKTIGGTTPDFATLHQAVQVLQVSIIGDGGVAFRIRAGTYTDSSLVIHRETDAAHPIRIEIDSGATVNLNYTSTGNYSYGLQVRTPFVTIDGSWPGDSVGKHLTISSTADLNRLVWFSDSATNGTIKNCFVSLPQTFSSSCIRVGDEFGGSNLTYSKMQILHCETNGGGSGIVFESQSGGVDSSVVSYCDVRDFMTYGMEFTTNSYYLHITQLQVSHNHIYSTTTNYSNSITGMRCGYNMYNCQINANWIGPLHSSLSAWVYGMYYQQGDSCSFTNNMIDVGASTFSGVSGLALYYSSNSHNTYLFNTIVVRGTSSNTYGSTALSYNNYYSDGTGSDTLWGNIIENVRTNSTGTGSHVALYGYMPSLVGMSDYNVIATGTTDTTTHRYVAQVYTVTTGWRGFGSLADLHSSGLWQHDLSSYDVTVPFVSDSNLHVRTDVPTVVESGAFHHWLVSNDFDDDVRTSPMCDIGADEGTFILTVRNNWDNLPREFALKQNYPNPFNPTTQVTFALPKPARVTLRIYNALGREVQRAIDNVSYSAGYHTIRLDGAQWANGVYFYQIVAGNNVATRKMILLK